MAILLLPPYLVSKMAVGVQQVQVQAGQPRQATTSIRDRDSEPVCAVVGASMRFPGSSGLAGFWASASSHSDVQSEVPYSRWNVDASYAPEARPGKMVTTTR